MYILLAIFRPLFLGSSAANLWLWRKLKPAWDQVAKHAEANTFMQQALETTRQNASDKIKTAEDQAHKCWLSMKKAQASLERNVGRAICVVCG
jgi:hypothetical protein